MRPSALLKLSLHENFTGQVLWIGLGVGVCVVGLAATLAGAALSHEVRALDTASYFLTDVILFLSAIFLGAHQFSRDFSNRGLAEITLTSGMRRESLFAWRVVAHSLSLLPLALLLFATRLASLALVELPSSQSASVWKAVLGSTALMFVFCVVKSTLACAAAAVLGVFVRPVIALLGTLGLFTLGHFSAGVSGLQGLIEDGGHLVSPSVNVMFRILRLWNPNALVLESFQGVWETPQALEIYTRLGWGMAFFGAFLSAGCLAVSRRDIGAFRL